MEDLMKIVELFEHWGISLKSLRKTIGNDEIKQRGGLLAMFLGTLSV